MYRILSIVVLVQKPKRKKLGKDMKRNVKKGKRIVNMLMILLNVLGLL